MPLFGKKDEKKKKAVEISPTPSIFRRLFSGHFWGTRNEPEIMPSSAGFGGEMPGGGYRSAFPSEDYVGGLPLGGTCGGNAPPTPPGFTPGMVPGGQYGGDCPSDPSGVYRFSQLPVDRISKYDIFCAMKNDPTISTAIRQHVTSALAPNGQTGKSISIETVNDNEDSKYVDDLRTTFETMMNEESFNLAFQAAIQGISFARLYGSPGKGVEKIRNDFYEQQRLVTIYEHVGETAGYINVFQDIMLGKMRLMPPWEYAAFRIPLFDNDAFIEPLRADVNPFDITKSDWRKEGLIESQKYGKSILEPAFDSWGDLQRAIVAMNMSRQGSAILERLVAVSNGGLDPAASARYLNDIARELDKTAILNHKEHIRRGYIPTIINRLIPIFSKGGDKGSVNVSEMKSTPDINAIEDIMFHARRMCAALGSDLSLVGFADQMSGGLSGGGWYRISIMAGMYAELIRRAIITGWEHIFNVHLAYKYNKIFVEKPWTLKFNSVSTAIETERTDNQTTSLNQAVLLMQLMTALKEYGSPKLSNFILTDIVTGLDEEKVREVMAEAAKPVSPEGEEGEPIPGLKSESDEPQEETEEEEPEEPEDDADEPEPVAEPEDRTERDIIKGKNKFEFPDDSDTGIRESVGGKKRKISAENARIKTAVYEAMTEMYSGNGRQTGNIGRQSAKKKRAAR